MSGTEELKFLLEGELARRWRVHIGTLQRWRYRGTGPKYVKVGGRILYPITALEIYEAQHLTTVVSHMMV
ncbi:helix-turn-helix domain-containing protein [Sphingopyxis sp.]|uniref:helix-turn-helix domain-containing protein n=1 Tax=Sphingopyxis sp. TaxID=1908224 RepID=UPI0034573E95